MTGVVADESAPAAIGGRSRGGRTKSYGSSPRLALGRREKLPREG
jgi:hypothetical protein